MDNEKPASDWLKRIKEIDIPLIKSAPRFGPFIGVTPWILPKDLKGTITITSGREEDNE